MTLEEAIKHCEKKAEECERDSNFDTDYVCYQMSEAERKELRECASEHRQLAEWLRNYEQIIESGDCNNCRNGKCEWKPLGRLVRYNCPHYVGISDGGKR